MSLETAKMVFGFITLLVLTGLAVVIGLGTVEEKTSYGLMPLIVAISNVAVMFGQWAFSNTSNRKSGGE